MLLNVLFRVTQVALLDVLLDEAFFDVLFGVAQVALLDVLLDEARVALLDVLFGVAQVALLEVLFDVVPVALLDVLLDPRLMSRRASLAFSCYVIVKWYACLTHLIFNPLLFFDFGSLGFVWADCF